MLFRVVGGFIVGMFAVGILVRLVTGDVATGGTQALLWAGGVAGGGYGAWSAMRRPGGTVAMTREAKRLQDEFVRL